MYGLIYYAINKHDGKRYVGQTVRSLQQRINSHIATSKLSNGVSHFSRAIKKYGYISFVWGVIDEAVGQKDLDEKEKYWIKLYDTMNPENGYNMIEGGSQFRLTPEIRQRIGLSNRGRKHSEEAIQKMRISHTGKSHSEETKKLMHNSKVGIPKSKEHRQKIGESEKGKVVSQDTKEKMSRSNPRSLSVVCVETGIRFGSMRNAERETGVGYSQIGKACKNVNLTAGKFHWQYGG